MDYKQEYERRKASGELAKMTRVNRRALEELAGVIPTTPLNCGKIASHVGWYTGKWVTDTCACGHKFKVPKGARGKYRCNCCADKDW